MRYALVGDAEPDAAGFALPTIIRLRRAPNDWGASRESFSTLNLRTLRRDP
jgi:hypothetical protein